MIFGDFFVKINRYIVFKKEIKKDKVFSDLMQNFLSKLKAFNSRHKRIVPLIIPFEILAIFVVSIYKNMSKVTKVIALSLAVILLIVFLAKHYIVADPKKTEGENEDTAIASNASDDEADSETSLVLVDIAVNEAAASESSFAVDEVSENDTASSDDSSNDTAEDSSAKEMPSDNNLSSKDNIEKFMKEYPESVGWLWFEDDLISQPIMQCEDNSKYSEKDYQGADSNTGAIFMDYRSSADLSDSNTIIYGHNMRDRSMFGAFKYYKENLAFLEDHKYFQIITPQGTKRYEIFAFMDVPKNSYIYDVIGQNPSNMREFLDTIEYKTYIDTGIEPTVDEKIITLSTCTQSDDLFFVMFAVEVDDN